MKLNPNYLCVPPVPRVLPVPSVQAIGEMNTNPPWLHWGKGETGGIETILAKQAVGETTVTAATTVGVGGSSPR